MADRIIHNQTEHRKMIAERRKKSDLRQVRTETVTSIDHMKAASQIIKEISALNIDDFVKKVLIMRIARPAICGQERSYESIALELGSSIVQVIEAEAYGICVVADYLGKFDIFEMVEKFDRDSGLQNEVRGIIHG